MATFITVVVVSETRVWRDAAEWGQGGGRLLLLPRQLSAGEHQLAGSSRPRLCFLRVWGDLSLDEQEPWAKLEGT